MESDRAIIERQLGRPPRAFRRVVVRCPFGRPAVTEQNAEDDSGEPFPTTFWLTCPHLVAAVSRLEAVGGVERWTRAAAEDRELRESLDRAHSEQRELRPSSTSESAARSRALAVSSVCTRTSHSLSRDRGTSWASASSPSSIRSGPLFAAVSNG